MLCNISILKQDDRLKICIPSDTSDAATFLSGDRRSCCVNKIGYMDEYKWFGLCGSVPSFDNVPESHMKYCFYFILLLPRCFLSKSYIFMLGSRFHFYRIENVKH